MPAKKKAKEVNIVKLIDVSNKLDELISITREIARALPDMHDLEDRLYELEKHLNDNSNLDIDEDW